MELGSGLAAYDDEPAPACSGDHDGGDEDDDEDDEDDEENEGGEDDEGGDNDDGVAEYMPTDYGREVTKDRRIFLRS